MRGVSPSLLKFPLSKQSISFNIERHSLERGMKGVRKNKTSIEV